MTVIVPAATRTTALVRDLVRFGAVGVVNTALYLAIYLVFRLVLPVTVANVLATLLTTVTGTNANGHVTFHVNGRIGVRSHLKSMLVTGLGLVITTGAVTMFDTGSAVGELVVLVIASAVAGTLRFILLRHWVFAPRKIHAGRPARLVTNLVEGPLLAAR
jgi:putative flippase GtrA